MSRFRKKNLNVMSINTLTLILAILFLTIGYDVQKRYFFPGTIFNEVVIILLPALLIARTGRTKEILKLKKISPLFVLLTVILVILAYPIILLLNGIFLSLLSNVVEYKNYPMEVFLQNIPLIRYVAVMCIVPAICEEIFFRGALLNSYSVYGNRFAVIMSAAVFALFHFDIQNFVAPFLLGIVFANIVEVTGSLYGSIVAHLTNNIVAVLAARYLNDTIFMYLRQTSMTRQIGSLELSIIILLTLISILSLVFIRMILRYMKRAGNSYGEMETVHYRDMEAIDIFNFVPMMALVILYFIYYYIVF